LRVLVVEDNDFNQLVTKEVLEGKGALVVIAGNGHEAVECLHSGKFSFDAVLMDVQMPIMDGYEATRKIRESLGKTRLPIIAMTANASEVDLQHCLEAGMNDHLTKPIQVELLVETLNRYCKIKPSETGYDAEPGIADFLMDSEEIAGLPGLNVADTIRKLNGNRLLYSQIALMVCKKYEDVAKQVEYLISSGDSATATQLLHTFKGVVLNLGAFKVGEFVGIFEEALTEGIAEDNQVQLLHRLDVLIAEAIDSLRIIADRYNPVHSDEMNLVQQK
jgi:CheY-like chemotaxis protein